MKKALILLLLISFQAMAKNQLNIAIKTNDEIFNKAITPIWNELPYDYNFSDKTFYQVLGNTVTVQIQNTHVNLGPKSMPLFDMKIKDENNFDLTWDLTKLTSTTRAKLRFKFKKYGINVTHDEYFIITTTGIKPSITNLNLVYQNKLFDFKSIKNSGFEFSKVVIKPEDGIGQILRFIFDNIFSKNEVDKFITKSINKELKKWINDNTIISGVKRSLNKTINNMQDTQIILSDIATHFKVQFKQFKFSKELVQIGIETKFNYQNLKVHSCATGMQNDFNKDSITVTHSLVETMIKNFATYETWNEDKLLEPLFCFGYQDYDDNGEALGSEVQSRILGKNIKFNYWARPITKPAYEYLPEEKFVKLTMNLEVKISADQYPLIRADNGKLVTKLVAYFNINFNPITGLNLEFNQFELPSITGRVKVKWNRFTPFIPVPLNTIRASIEKYLNKTGINELSSINVIQPTLNLTNDLKLEISNYEMKPDAHEIIFQIK